MYTPSHFSETRIEVLHDFIAEHPLAALIAPTADGLDANHIPVLLDPTRGPFGTLRGHVARANPMWKKVPDGSRALALFQGPTHYISPGWYPSKRTDNTVVPTWNYVVVHAHGTLTWTHDFAWLLRLVNDLADTFERDRKEPWRVSDAPADWVEGQLKAVVGFELAIERLEGKWKVSQNRSAADREGVVAGLAEVSGEDARKMAELVARTKL